MNAFERIEENRKAYVSEIFNLIKDISNEYKLISFNRYSINSNNKDKFADHVSRFTKTLDNTFCNLIQKYIDIKTDFPLPKDREYSRDENAGAVLTSKFLTDDIISCDYLFCVEFTLDGKEISEKLTLEEYLRCVNDLFDSLWNCKYGRFVGNDLTETNTIQAAIEAVDSGELVDSVDYLDLSYDNNFPKWCRDIRYNVSNHYSKVYNPALIEEILNSAKISIVDEIKYDTVSLR